MKNQAFLDEARDVLATYKLSDSYIPTLNETNLLFLVAPSSAGRNKTIRELVNSGGFHYIVSDTTRAPRDNDGVVEQNGHEYWFKKETDMLDGLKNGKYLAPAIIHNQQVSGISIDELKKASENNQVAVTDIEIQGAESVMRVKPDTVAIFMLPPSFEEWMRRIKTRGKMSDEEFKRRLNSSLAEFNYALTNDKFIYVINEDFHETAKTIERLMREEKADIEYQHAGRKLTAQLLAEVYKYLNPKN